MDPPEEATLFIGYFTERPYQDPESGYFGETSKPIMDLTVSNEIYDAKLGAELYNRYLDEKVYAEEMGFDGLMLNEHHNTAFCMGGAMNVEASILARVTNRAKIVLLGNILPIWDDPLDMISRGRLCGARAARAYPTTRLHPTTGSGSRRPTSSSGWWSSWR